MSVSCECWVLSGRGLCFAQESYRVCCFWVWSWSLDNEGDLEHLGLWSHKKKVTLDLCLLRINSARTGRTQSSWGSRWELQNVSEEKTFRLFLATKKTDRSLYFRNPFYPLTEELYKQHFQKGPFSSNKLQGATSQMAVNVIFAVVRNPYFNKTFGALRQHKKFRMFLSQLHCKNRS